MDWYLPRNPGEQTSNSCASKSFSHNPVLQFHEGEYSFLFKIKENEGREKVQTFSYKRNKY